MKIINKTKIEWCDYVWNPIWGCKNNCLYCYARKIAKRFASKIGIYPDRIEKIKNFKPVWIYENFNKNFPKKSSNIFVNSMSDFYFWEPIWMKNVLNKIKQYPQHKFLFLTKFPEIYLDFIFPENCFLGATFIKQSDFQLLSCLDFISIEPIQEMIDLSKWKKGISKKIKWIILGMESGNRKNKIIPNIDWIYNIHGFCCLNDIPIFMKNNLKSIYSRILIQQFPKELNHGILS